MKDTRFIELLNLYVDQQLTAVEATELESEIKQSPGSRRTYQQYCRMQKGCAQLFEQGCQAAPSTSALAKALAEAEQKVTAFPAQDQPTQSQWRQRGFYAAGLAAMAACIAFVLVRQAPVAAPVAAQNAPSVAVNTPIDAGAVAVVEPTVVAPAAQTVAIPPADPQPAELRQLYAVFPVRKFVPVQVVSFSGETVAPVEDRPDFNWMKTVEIAPMRRIGGETITTDPSANLQQPANIFIESRRPVQDLYKTAAFQFQK